MRPLLAALLLSLAVQVVDLAIGVPPLLDGGLFDADCYSRLARVLQLHDTAAWWDRLDPRVNAPFGETLQWTRPLDVLIELLAEPLGLMMGYRPALFLAGAAVSPLLLVTTLALLWWGWRRSLGGGGFLLLAALLQLSPSLIATFLPGRPDHHGLLAALFLAQLTLTHRALEDGEARYSAVSGALGGLALWVSIESAVPQALFGLSLVGCWLAGRLSVTHVARFALALAGATALALAIEFPPALWPVPAYDRISVAQLLPLAANAGLWQLVATVQPRRSWPTVLATGAVLAAVTLGLFPKLLAGPFVDHGELGRQWLEGVAEWQPLWPTDRQRAAAMFNELGPALVVLPWLAGRRDAWSRICLAGVLLFSALSLQAVRWASYAQAAMLPPWTVLVCHLWTRQDLAMRRLAAVSAIAIGFVLALLCGPAGRNGAEARACPVPAVAGALSGLPAHGVLLTYLYIGPELEWRTGLDLVGIPSANQASIADTGTVLAASDDARALEVLARRRVDYLLICPDGGMAADYRRPDGKGLHQRLERGEVPDWLAPLPLPAAAGGFRLFKVDPGRR